MRQGGRGTCSPKTRTPGDPNLIFLGPKDSESRVKGSFGDLGVTASRGACRILHRGMKADKCQEWLEMASPQTPNSKK